MPEDDLARYYARRAAEYDRIYAKPERQDDLRAIRRWLAGQVQGGRVLEVACGTGWRTPCIARAAVAVVALDLNPEPVAIARTLRPRPNVLYGQADAFALPASGAAGPGFSHGFAGFWFSHLRRAQQRAWLAGFEAALAPGARALLLDNRFVPGSSTPIAEQDADGDTWQHRRLDDGSVHRVLKNFPTPAQLRACCGRTAEVVEWPHFWAVAWRTPN